MTHNVSMIAAIGAKNRVIGKDNDLIWKIPSDLDNFRKVTRGHPVIMGRKTWESLPKRPLPGRNNIVITRDRAYEAVGGITCATIEEALDLGRKSPGSEEIFIIGGGQIYEEGLPFANRLYLSLIKSPADGDTFFPDYSEFKRVVECKPHDTENPPYEFVILER